MKIYFVGIGGIGVSALAKYYLEKGYKVSGSDLLSSEITKSLEKQGAKIFIGKHKPRSVLGTVDLVIYSPAVPKDNPELKETRKLGIKCQSYPQALGELTKKYFTIAIAGTHGKSTVTAMTGLLLKKAGLDPTVIVGTKLKEFQNSNYRAGKSEYLVIEADEHMASFLNYWPKIIVLTNIEKEHLDYYKNLKQILKTYKNYVNHLPKNGFLIANKDDKNILQLTRNKKQKTVFFSIKQKGAKNLKKILKIPGEHNVSNALAALTTARVLKIPDKISFNSLSEYRGSWRRFEIKKSTINGKKTTIISDFAHHPTEIKSTFEAVREKFGERKIWCVYQPHQYQRTYYLFKDFVKVFKEALRETQGKPLVDSLIITDIYDVVGREEKKIKERVNSKKLVEAINKNRAIYPHTKRGQSRLKSGKIDEVSPRYGVGVYIKKEAIINYLKRNLRGGEVVIIMGAGDIYELVDSFK